MKVVFGLLCLVAFAVAQEVANGYSVTACENNKAKLECETGTILVSYAIYGRINSETCPGTNSQNTGCDNEVTADVGSFCDGLTSCKVKAKNNVFGDPCGGTYKYLVVDYTCETEPLPDTGDETSSANSLVVCENQGNADISCPAGEVITITEAMYGRTTSATCPGVNSNNVACPNAETPLVAGECDGHESCSIPATNGVFGDPCYGTYKYLVVDWTCSAVTSDNTNSDPVVVTETDPSLNNDGTAPTGDSLTVCEHDTADISCPAGEVIKVSYAIYGRVDDAICPGTNSHLTTCDNDETTLVQAACDDLESCSIRAKNHVFDDPCVGTYKYLTIDYTCEAESAVVEDTGVDQIGDSITVCENQGTADLDCGDGVIDITYAIYGRVDSTICPGTNSHLTTCDNDETPLVQAECNGQSTCSVNAVNSVFHDPCVGIYKYLTIDYTCSGGSTDVTSSSSGSSNSGAAQFTEADIPDRAPLTSETEQCLDGTWDSKWWGRKNPPADKVAICHGTASDSNPFTLVNVDMNGAVSHLLGMQASNGQKRDDIWPMSINAEDGCRYDCNCEKMGVGEPSLDVSVNADGASITGVLVAGGYEADESYVVYLSGVPSDVSLDHGTRLSDGRYEITERPSEDTIYINGYGTFTIEAIAVATLACDGSKAFSDTVHLQIDIANPAVDCVGEWTQSGSCDVTCGGGTVTQTYSIQTPAEHGGAECHFADGDTMSKLCNDEECPVEHDELITEQGPRQLLLDHNSCVAWRCTGVYCAVSKDAGLTWTHTPLDMHSLIGYDGRTLFGKSKDGSIVMSHDKGHKFSDGHAHYESGTQLEFMAKDAPETEELQFVEECGGSKWEFNSEGVLVTVVSSGEQWALCWDCFCNLL